MMRIKPNRDDYYCHEQCPPKLRGEKCYGDCWDCRDQDFYDFKKGKVIVPKNTHVQMPLPNENKCYMFRGSITE